MSEILAEFDPPNRVGGPIVSKEHADHVRVRIAAIVLLIGPEFLRLRQVVREDIEHLIAWEEEQG